MNKGIQNLVNIICNDYRDEQNNNKKLHDTNLVSKILDIETINQFTVKPKILENVVNMKTEIVEPKIIQNVVDMKTEVAR